MKKKLSDVLCTMSTVFLLLGWEARNFQKPSEADLKAKLSKIQFDVTQKEGTEPPFKNEFHDNKRPGIYVDVVSGEPLFSSIDKYDSGTGWPSFIRPLVEENIKTKTDYKLLLPRTEVRSRYADSHLGHVFDDGPQPTGKRYCINSAALRFVAAADLTKEGYPEFAKLFSDNTGAKAGPQDHFEKAYFAGGCFWCTEADFEKVAGVVEVRSGFIGGTSPNPTYKQVSSGTTDYAEAVEVTYDPTKVSYKKLLNVYWKSIDPTAENRQFCDSGRQYRSGIFYAGDTQERLSKESLKILSDARKFKTIYTTIEKAGPFYPAEAEHQDFYKKQPEHYRNYRLGCGRDKRLQELWAGFPGVFKETESN